MFYALLYAVVGRILSLGGLSSVTEAEVLVLRHELAVLRRQIKRPRWRRRDVASAHPSAASSVSSIAASRRSSSSGLMVAGYALMPSPGA